ncbi:hypothetical protein [Kitasatospora sp. NPDC088783]|uniref:hypothetical protein n=1 Tax=Kitasatospora sp. NPDC088783 TaxID=3364077 RepID=UPI00380E1FDE
MRDGRPLLYLDVDGPLNPDCARPPAGYEVHRMLPQAWLDQHPGKPRVYVKPLKVRLNPAHGAALRRLAGVFDLVWATTWEDEANTFISPVLGLGELPVVPWPPAARRTGAGGVFWKTQPLLEHAAHRPFAWVDDDVTDADSAFVAARHGAPALLLRIDAARGLREGDFEALESFAAAAGRA